MALSLTEHLPQIEDAVATYNAILLVIDPILALTGRKDTHKASDVRAILAPLAAMAERTGCAVVTILHLNKNSKEGNALYRVTSSLDFVAAARSARHATAEPARAAVADGRGRILRFEF